MKKLSKNQIIKYISIIVLTIFIAGLSNTSITQAAAKYTISPKSSTYKKNYKKSDLYNSATKQYFVIRSYLEQLEKKGGGKLI